MAVSLPKSDNYGIIYGVIITQNEREHNFV